MSLLIPYIFEALTRDVPDPHFFRIQDFTESLIRIPDSEPDSGSGF